ncbi:MAG: hypothetical protein ACYDDF_11495 [Thermoplasmatota archaeon]
MKAILLLSFGLVAFAAILILCGQANAANPIGVPCSTTSSTTLRTNIGSSSATDAQGRNDYIQITVPTPDCANLLGLTGLVNQGETLSTGGAAWTLTYHTQQNLQTTAPTDVKLYLASDAATMGWSTCAGSGSGATTPTSGDYVWALDLGAPTDGATFTTHLTTDGTATGTPLMGTYRFVLYIEAKQNANVYLYSETSDGTTECSQTGFPNVCNNVDAFTQCAANLFVDGTAATSFTTTNGAGPQSLYAYPDTLTATLGFNQTAPVTSGENQITAFYLAPECPIGTFVNFNGNQFIVSTTPASYSAAMTVGTNFPSTTTTCREDGTWLSSSGGAPSLCDAWSIYRGGPSGTGYQCAYFTGSTIAGSTISADKFSVFLPNAFAINAGIYFDSAGTHATPDGNVNIAGLPATRVVNRGFTTPYNYFLENARGTALACAPSAGSIHAAAQTDAHGVHYADTLVTTQTPARSGTQYSGTYTIGPTDPAFWSTGGRAWFWTATLTCLAQANPTATSNSPLSVSFLLNYDAITHYIDGTPAPQTNDSNFIIGSDLLDSRSHVTNVNDIATQGITTLVVLISKTGTTDASATGLTQADSWSPHAATGSPMTFNPQPPGGLTTLNGSATDGLGNQGWAQITVTFVSPFTAERQIDITLAAFDTIDPQPAWANFSIEFRTQIPTTGQLAPIAPDDVPRWQVRAWSQTNHVWYNQTPATSLLQVGTKGCRGPAGDCFWVNWTVPANWTNGNRYLLLVSANVTGTLLHTTLEVPLTTGGAGLNALTQVTLTTSLDPWIPILIWGGLLIFCLWLNAWFPAFCSLLALADYLLSTYPTHPTTTLSFVGRILLFTLAIFLHALWLAAKRWWFNQDNAQNEGA